jgi:asparagine synthase (glutamine-hydrolysing)
MKKPLTNESVGILYSGGLDSSILTKLLTKLYWPERVILVTIGVEGSYDIKNAIAGAREIETTLNMCLLTTTNVKQSIEDILHHNLVNRVGELSIAIPLYLGFQFLSQNFDTKLVFLGQGADELFGGYKKYITVYAESGIEEVKAQMNRDLNLMMNQQMRMEKNIASIFGISLYYPFLSTKVIEFAQSIPVSDHIEYKYKEKPNRKVVLRKLAKEIGLSDNIANQPKKALQYGSGTIKLLKKIAKEAGYSQLHSWFNAIAEK